jgi:hypothetical protein
MGLRRGVSWSSPHQEESCRLKSRAAQRRRIEESVPGPAHFLHNLAWSLGEKALVLDSYSCVISQFPKKLITACHHGMKYQRQFPRRPRILKVHLVSALGGDPWRFDE